MHAYFQVPARARRPALVGHRTANWSQAPAMRSARGSSSIIPAPVIAQPPSSVPGNTHATSRPAPSVPVPTLLFTAGLLMLASAALEVRQARAPPLLHISEADDPGRQLALRAIDDTKSFGPTCRFTFLRPDFAVDDRGKVSRALRPVTSHPISSLLFSLFLTGTTPPTPYDTESDRSPFHTMYSTRLRLQTRKYCCATENRRCKATRLLRHISGRNHAV